MGEIATLKGAPDRAPAAALDDLRAQVRGAVASQAQYDPENRFRINNNIQPACREKSWSVPTPSAA
jgi:hypothetical protein